MSEAFVLDASAVLCLIRAEPGADVVKAALPQSRISAVNLTEVIGKLSELGLQTEVISQVLDPLRLRVVPFDERDAWSSGEMRRATRELGLSLGDRACLSLAARLGVTALTTDRAWDRANAIANVAFAR